LADTGGVGDDDDDDDDDDDARAAGVGPIAVDDRPSVTSPTPRPQKGTAKARNISEAMQPSPIVALASRDQRLDSEKENVSELTSKPPWRGAGAVDNPQGFTDAGASPRDQAIENENFDRQTASKPPNTPRGQRPPDIDSQDYSESLKKKAKAFLNAGLKKRNKQKDLEVAASGSRDSPVQVELRSYRVRPRGVTSPGP
jgi:hypothetical protein